MTGIGKFFLKINSYNPLGCAKHLHLGTIKNVSTVNYQSLNKWGVYMLLFYWSFLRLPVTWKVRKNAAVAF